MSSVIPKDRTGMVRHPFKLDCWIPGESNGHDNLCMEIPIGEMMECTLGKPDLSALTHNHLTQIQMELWNNRGGGPEGKIINSFYSGATPDQLMSSKEVQVLRPPTVCAFSWVKRKATTAHPTAAWRSCVAIWTI